MPLSPTKIESDFSLLAIFRGMASGVRHHPAHGLQIAAVHERALTQAHFPFGVFFGENMPQILFAAFKLAGASGGKPLGRATSGL